MPKIYSPGNVIKGKLSNYTIKKIMNQGNFAISYEANDTHGRRIFLKQYIDPTPASGREYQDFKTHQEEVKKILDTLDVVEKNYDYFEYEECYFQAKEFMEGKDLENFLKENPSVDERFLIATVFMYGIRKIHESGIVHTDLKPQQVYLKYNPSINLKYEVKIVDFDFCRIPGKSEPIHIAGTPFYWSPEHINGEKPDFSSDIFTCGIILYQILGGTEPHPGKDEEEYKNNVLRYKIDKKLRDLNPEVSESLSNLIYRMLDPQKDNRPTAIEVHEQLLKEIDTRRTGRVASVSPPATSPKIPVRIEFHYSGVSYPVSAHKTMRLGRDNFRSYGEGYKYLEREQFEVIKTDSGWKIKGLPTTNPTLLNGIDCTGKEVDITDGSKLKIGNFEVQIKFVF
jgi:serine/threonine-protein kinase